MSLPSYRFTLALYQQRLAMFGRALNQCPECRAYRLDGQPPKLHDDTCSAYTSPQQRKEG